MIVGIDNGREGAMVLVDSDSGFLEHALFVIDGNKFLDHQRVRAKLDGWHDEHGPLDIWVESAGSRPTDRHYTAFGVGKHAASIHAALADFLGGRIRCGDTTPRGRVSYVHPSTWTAALNLRGGSGSKSEKKALRVQAANLFFGTEIRNHNIADAALIAAFGATQN